MASVTITTNLAQVVDKLRTNFEKLKDKEYLLRPLAIETIPLMKERIHEKGQASDGSQIGTYSSGYMKVRTGNYGNSVKFAKGKNKGKIKNAGTFTKKKITFGDSFDSDGGNVFGKSVFNKRNDNAARPNYNRDSSTKVIISLTRQLENDYSVQPTNKGYGIGFNNKFNKEKSEWVEETYKKIIFNLSAEEKKYITERIDELVDGAINP